MTDLWAETFDRELTAADIFAIQSEVAAAIAAALKGALTPAERARTGSVPTDSLEAWETYQEGRQRLARRTSGDLAAAETLFRKAIEIDADFALAHVGLADALYLQVPYAGLPWRATYAKAASAVETALKLDPDLGEAWATSGLLASVQQQPDLAERNYRRAIELSPSYAPAHLWLGMLYRSLGRLAEAKVEGERAVELDPFSGIANYNLTETLVALGRFRDAEDQFRKLIQIDPASPGPYAGLGHMLVYAQNRFADGILLERKAAQLDPGNPGLESNLHDMLTDLGDMDALHRVLAGDLARWPDDWRMTSSMAYAKLLASDHDAALRSALKTLEGEPRHWLALNIARIEDLKTDDHRATRARYERGYPELFDSEAPRIDGTNYWVAYDVVPALRSTGESRRATQILDRIERFIRPLPRLGRYGYWITDAQIHALRGDKIEALAALRDAVDSGWRGPSWQYYRDFDPNLASIRNEPEFKAVFADIERDMARQRAELDTRQKGTGKSSVRSPIEGASQGGVPISSN